ncbi:DUF443 family protein [Streptococcus pluranimalium]
METIQFYSKGNMRYVLFQIDGQHYLLDRRPRHLLVYLFFPLNWKLYHNIYMITPEEYQKINKKYMKASRFTIPTSLIAGSVVFLNSWTRLRGIDTFERFNTDFSMSVKWILLIFGVLIVFPLLQLFYSSRKKSMEKLIGRELTNALYYKLKPQKTLKLFFNLFMLLLFAFVMLICFAIAFLYLGNLAMLVSAMLMSFLCLCAANGTYSDNEKWKYEIVDICPSYESNVK